MIWTHGEDKLQEFISYLKGIHPTIKFTSEHSHTHINFLNTTVKINDNRKLYTTLYEKPTDTYLYLHYTSSYHSKSKAKGPYGQFLGPRRICTYENDFHESRHLKDLPKQITCELSNVIYFISCRKCHKHYVGETSGALRKRMYEHRVTVQKDGQITPVSHHFKSDGHNHKDMKFSVLEWCTPKFETSNTARRRRLELSWIFRLHCLAPLGINQFV